MFSNKNPKISKKERFCLVSDAVWGRLGDVFKLPHGSTGQKKVVLLGIWVVLASGRVIRGCWDIIFEAS